MVQMSPIQSAFWRDLMAPFHESQRLTVLGRGERGELA